MGEDARGDWLPLLDAAQRCGRHVDTLRRWAKSGRIRARRLMAPERIEVWYPDIERETAPRPVVGEAEEDRET